LDGALPPLDVRPQCRQLAGQRIEAGEDGQETVRLANVQRHQSTAWIHPMPNKPRDAEAKRPRELDAEDKAQRDLDFDSELVAARVDGWSDEQLLERVGQVAYALGRRARCGASGFAGLEVSLQYASHVVAAVQHALEARDERMLHKLAVLADSAMPAGVIPHFNSQSDCFNWLAARCHQVLGPWAERLSPADRTASAERVAAKLADHFPFWLSWCVQILEGRPPSEVGVPSNTLDERLRSTFTAILTEAKAAEWTGGNASAQVVRAGARELGVPKHVVKGAFDVKTKAERRRRRSRTNE
jgi:hypothetical protein